MVDIFIVVGRLILSPFHVGGITCVEVIEGSK